MGSVYLLGASHNALGLLNAGTNLVKFARTVLPINPYNLTFINLVRTSDGGDGVVQVGR